jgi:type I restriction enzyme S subunit
VIDRHKRLASTVVLSIDRLREFRSALVTAAVTGQIDVVNWGKHGQTDRRLDRIEEAMRA